MIFYSAAIVVKVFLFLRSSLLFPILKNKISSLTVPQQHETFLPNGDRAAYLIGDGAGVGKGRTIAGIIYENYLLGRKRSLW